MSEVVSIDIVEGSGVRKTNLGYEFDRIAIVKNVTGVGHSRMIQAIQAVITEVGDIGDSHPQDSSSKIIGFDCRPLSNQEFEVRVDYRYSSVVLVDEIQIEVEGSLVQEESNIDAFGSVISVQHAYPSNYGDNGEGNPAKAGRTIQQGGMVQRPIPTVVLTITRRDLFNPLTLSKQYTGKLNDGPWAWGPGDVARTWLCAGITGTSDDGGVSYRNRYSFQYRPDKWDATVVFIDSDTGKPPTGLVNNVGYKRVQITGTANFNALGL